MVAVARVENIALGARLSIWAGLPRAIAYVGPQTDGLAKAPFDEVMWEMEDSLMS